LRNPDSNDLFKSTRNSPIPSSSPSASVPTSPAEKLNLKALTISTTVAPPALKMPAESSSDLLARVPAQLHLFDAVDGVFMLQDNNVTASVIDAGNWECLPPQPVICDPADAKIG
jgi:hypothetical protein